MRNMRALWFCIQFLVSAFQSASKRDASVFGDSGVATDRVGFAELFKDGFPAQGSCLFYGFPAGNFGDHT